MSYFALHAYDADVWLRDFRGLNQSDVEMNPDIRFAAEEENIETIHGVLQPQAAFDILPGPLGDSSPRIETLVALHRRWYTGDGEPTFYVCAAGGKLYYKQAHQDIRPWTEIPMPTGWVGDTYASNTWSCVNYEHTAGENMPTVDTLLLSNADDGLIMIIPPAQNNTWGATKSNGKKWNQFTTWTAILNADYWQAEKVDNRGNPEHAPDDIQNFAVIERFGDRIFGTGQKDEPDKIAYSRYQNPLNWAVSSDLDLPEIGGMDIYQPSWDGDRFFALKRFGDQLLCFKKNKIWRLTGLSPGEYAFSEQYGYGTEFPNTICVDGNKVYMVTRKGMAVYDGMNTTLYAKEQTEKIWDTVNQSALDQMCATLYDERYYVAFPTGTSTVNNAMLVYDMREGNIHFYPDIMIESFMPADNELLATSSSLPGKFIRLNWDSWAKGATSGFASRWATPWMDFGYKRIQKGGFDFYFLPEVQDEEVTFTITIQTEKKMKSKRYTCVPLTEEQKAVPKEHRMKKLHFGGSGRKFRVIIETDDGATAPWRIVGGLQLVVETDPD